MSVPRQISDDAGARTAELRDTPGLRMAIDYGPVLVFFAVNFLAPAEPMPKA